MTRGTKKTDDTNSNVNTNTINVNIKNPVKRSYQSKTVKKKSGQNWYIKTTIGGIIALILALGGYYIQKQMDAKNNANPDSLPTNNQIEGTRQN